MVHFKDFSSDKKKYGFSSGFFGGIRWICFGNPQKVGYNHLKEVKI
jgi:hypothetical protein